MLTDVKFDVPAQWESVLAHEIHSPNFTNLQRYIADEISAGKTIYPPQEHRFLALKYIDPASVKAVILGQDPYHGDGQAHGLAFSVPDGVRPPPSLKNIFKEIQRDLSIAPSNSGSLVRWAKQGVLLLNTVLSVEQGKPGSHQGRGWEEISDVIIAHLGNQTEPSVFMLWGKHAQKKRALIDGSRHLILEAPHPSPLSAHRGFIGCGHFSKANVFLEKNGRSPIAW